MVVKGVVVAALATLAVVAPAGASPSSKAALKLVTSRPLVVEGASFKGAERVRLTLTTSTEVVHHRVVASRAGAFRSNFGTVTFGRCGGFTVRAVGSRGTTVLLRKLPLPACMPERSP